MGNHLGFLPYHRFCQNETGMAKATRIIAPTQTFNRKRIASKGPCGNRASAGKIESLSAVTMDGHEKVRHCGVPSFRQKKESHYLG
jgi:hypothetical protein